MAPQPGILAAVPAAARHLTFQRGAGGEPLAALRALAPLVDGDTVVVGIGASLIRSLGRRIDGLRAFPTPHGLVEVPATPADLWVWLRGSDRGELLHAGRRVRAAVAPHLAVDEVVDTFMYSESRDLSGYEDGTENPEGDAAVAAALVQGAGAGLDGSSFAAVQRWVHDLDRFEALTETQRDHTFGRRHRDNEEIEDAPESAHVKRTAQEDFEPEAFVVRRSMPWGDQRGEGLVFLAFGRSLDAFEAQLTRMVGAEDGVVDALFSFTRPVTGASFWCPPMADGHLDLRALGL